MAKKPDRRDAWTSVAIHKETDALIKELAKVVGNARGHIGVFAKHEAVHLAVREALQRRGGKGKADEGD